MEAWLREEIVILIMVILLYVAVFYFTLRFPLFRNIMSRLVRRLFDGLFLSDIFVDRQTERLRDEVNDLRRDVARLTSGKEQQALAIREYISGFIDQNLRPILKGKLEDEEIVDRFILERLDAKVRDAAVSALSTYKPADLARAHASAYNLESLNAASAELAEVVENERRSAARLRTVMVNLFVLFNVGLLIVYIVLGSDLHPTLAYTVSGTYLSLAIFIIYIIRTSHYRSGMLLAVRENIRNQAVMMAFLDSRGQQLTDADVDVARSLMTNHAERERHAEHPYELILKHVSGTNIQFRGGKMQIGAPTQARS